MRKLCGTKGHYSQINQEKTYEKPRKSLWNKGFSQFFLVFPRFFLVFPRSSLFFLSFSQVCLGFPSFFRCSYARGVQKILWEGLEIMYPLFDLQPFSIAGQSTHASDLRSETRDSIGCYNDLQRFCNDLRSLFNNR